MDWSALMLDPIYTAIGVDATITLEGGTEVSVTAIDKTSGIEVVTAHGVDFPTITPAAIVRMSDLDASSVLRTDLDGSEILMNDRTWRITSHILKPTPAGELAGEVYLLLTDEN